MNDSQPNYISGFRESKTVKISLACLLIIAVGFILHVLQVVLKPLLIAIIMSYTFEPLIKKMSRHHIPKVIAICIALIITVISFYLVGLILYTNIEAFGQEFPAYQEKFMQIYLKIINYLNIPHKEVVAFYSQINWKDVLEKMSLPMVLSSTIGSIISFIGNLFLVLLYIVYLLMGRDHFVSSIAKAFPGNRSKKIYLILGRINQGIQKYFIAKTLISLGMGLTAAIVLLIFGIDFAWFWGLLSFLLNFIPTIGAVVATIPPILVAMFQYGGFFPAFWIGVLLILLHMIWGNIIEPSVMGKSLNMSPLVVIFSLIFWGFIWGPVGMILAVPISSTLQIICSNVEALKPISILMTEQ